MFLGSVVGLEDVRFLRFGEEGVVVGFEVGRWLEVVLSIEEFGIRID